MCEGNGHHCECLCAFLLTFLWPVFVTCYYNQVGETVYMFLTFS